MPMCVWYVSYMILDTTPPNLSFKERQYWQNVCVLTHLFIRVVELAVSLHGGWGKEGKKTGNTS